jgi:hypothetical protein
VNVSIEYTIYAFLPDKDFNAENNARYTTFNHEELARVLIAEGILVVDVLILVVNILGVD